MKYILVGLLLIVFLFLLFKVLFKMMKMRYISDVSGETRSGYMIYFSSVEVPNLEENRRLKEVISIQKSVENGYYVLSSLNDVRLKELLREEYNLQPSNIIISTPQILLSML